MLENAYVDESSIFSFHLHQEQLINVFGKFCYIKLFQSQKHKIAGEHSNVKQMVSFGRREDDGIVSSKESEKKIWRIQVIAAQISFKKKH